MATATPCVSALAVAARATTLAADISSARARFTPANARAVIAVATTATATTMIVPSDVDATHVPLHGQQERGFFHGYYDNDCYLPLYVF